MYGVIALVIGVCEILIHWFYLHFTALELEEWKKGIPLKREGLPEDVANICAFLAADQSSYITGQVINVDGGMVT